MVVERYLAAPVLKLEPSRSPKILQGYFRSKLFMNTNTRNPFVAAANPLLSFVDQSLDHLHQLQDLFHSEMNHLDVKILLRDCNRATVNVVLG